MRENHGIADAVKKAMVDNDIQAVVVTDGHDEVLLSLDSSSYPAGLSPDRARFIAGCLVASAERIENTRTK